MPIGATKKEERQYEHIKESEKKRGLSTRRAKQIAAATVNKQRSKKKSGGRKKATSHRKS